MFCFYDESFFMWDFSLVITYLTLVAFNIFVLGLA